MLKAEPVCTNKHFTQIFQASGPSKKNGILMAIKNSITFTLHNSLVDDEGRYLALDCTLCNIRYTIVNIYAPNSNQIRFYKKLMKKIHVFYHGHLILCEDFNIVPDNTTDTSSHNSRLLSPMGSFIRSNDIYNVWRCHHTTERDYSFFSHRHNSYTRIDYFLVDKWLLPKITVSNISTITWSDYAPITMTTNDTPARSQPQIWRANPWILHLPDHSAYIQKNLEKFFKLNKGTVSSITTVWNTHKAFIRRIIMQVGARERRKRSQCLDTLTSSIKLLETQNQISPDPALKTELNRLRQELRTHLLDTFEKAQTRFKAMHYSPGNKAGKAMATRLKGHYAKSKITHLYQPTTHKKITRTTSYR